MPRFALPRIPTLLLPAIVFGSLVGCGQTGPLYLPEKPVEESVTEIDVTEGDVSDEVGVGAEAGVEAGIEASRESGLEDGLEGPPAGPIEGGATAIDDEVLIEADDEGDSRKP